MRAVRVPQHLNAMVDVIADDKVAISIKREEAPVAAKLAVAAALAAHAAHVSTITESEHLHARVAVIKHGKVASAVTSDRGGTIELAVAAAAGADASNMRAITVPQHLHAVITVIGYKDMPRPVKGNAKGA